MCSFFILWWMWLCTAPIFGLLGIMVLEIWGYKYSYFTPLSNIPNGIAGSYCNSTFSTLFFFLPFSYSWRSPRDTVMLHSSLVLSWSSVGPLLEPAGGWLPSMIRAQALHNAQGSICIAGRLQVGSQPVLANAVMWQDTTLSPSLLQFTDPYGSVWTPGLIPSSWVCFPQQLTIPLTNSCAAMVHPEDEGFQDLFGNYPNRWIEQSQVKFWWWTNNQSFKPRPCPNLKRALFLNVYPQLKDWKLRKF